VTWAVLLGCAATLALAGFGPRLGRRLPPPIATRLMGTAAVALAAITLWALGVLAFTAIAQVPLVAAFGDWSTSILRATDPVPMWVGIASGLVWLGLAGLALRGFVRRIAALRALRRLDRSLSAPGTLVILESDRPDAFSTPGAHGRVYVTTGMLRVLRPDERRALLAHEASHLTHRHAWWLIASDLAAVVNPMLVPTARAIAHGVERWADEDAAREIGDRGAVARAVARAALHVHASTSGAGTPDGAASRDGAAFPHGAAFPDGAATVGSGITAGVRATQPVRAAGTAAIGGQVPDRVQALLLAPPRARLLPVLALTALLAASLGSGFAIQNHTEEYFDHASACPGPTCGQRPQLRLHLGPRHPIAPVRQASLVRYTTKPTGGARR
jgi:hypothetical protein